MPKRVYRCPNCGMGFKHEVHRRECLGKRVLGSMSNLAYKGESWKDWPLSHLSDKGERRQDG